MPLTASQNRMYWAEWGKAKAALQAKGYMDSKEVNEHRSYLTIKALGRDKSSKKLNNCDLEKILAEFRAISNPGDLNGQLKLQQAEANRLIYGIEQLNLSPAYLENIATDKFGTSNWRKLRLEHLKQFHMTVKNRARKTKS